MDKVQGNDSQDTTVYEGLFQKRPVPGKRMLKNFIKKA